MGPRSRASRASSRRDVVQPLAPEQEASLLFMLEEEKLAGDIYEVFAQQTGLAVFSRISASEDRHYAALLRSAETAGLAIDAITGLPAGEYVNAELQALYDALLEQGSLSERAALEVGALVERTDIADLQSAIGSLSDTRLADIYSRLLQGSIHHLEAFTDPMALLQ